jgi:hypothetical protein
MKMMFNRRQLWVFVVLVSTLLTGIFLGESQAASEANLSRGQTIYIPVYSHVYHGPKQHTFDLTASLSIRNVEPAASITITWVRYYDSKGKLLKSYLDKPVKLGPLASVHYTIKESDSAGGFGANFLTKWTSDSNVNQPIAECVMIGTAGQQGISFLTTGRVIQVGN